MTSSWVMPGWIDLKSAVALPNALCSLADALFPVVEQPVKKTTEANEE
jgi:hypothetical protein